MTLRVLVVDDDETTRSILSRLLASEGHTVETCESADLALELLRQGAYDTLLTDLVMTGMNGLELVARARSLLPALRCIVMSGHARDTRASADVAWVGKPIDFDALNELLCAEVPSP